MPCACLPYVLSDSVHHVLLSAVLTSDFTVRRQRRQHPRNQTAHQCAHGREAIACLMTQLRPFKRGDFGFCERMAYGSRQGARELRIPQRRGDSSWVAPVSGLQAKFAVNTERHTKMGKGKKALM